MSAIGDYVHWSYNGYVKEKGAKKQPYFKSYKSALTNRENQFYQWVQQQENKAIKELEQETQKSLDLLKSFKENKGNISQVENNEMAMALLEDLWNELDTKYLKVDKIAAASSGLMEVGGFKSGSNIGKKTFHQQATTGNVNAQIEALLNTTLAGINNSISQILTDQDLKTSEIQKAVDKTQKNISTMMEKLNAQGKIITSGTKGKTAENINKIFRELTKAIQGNQKLNESIDIVGLLNTLAFGLNGSTTENQYKGDISEALVAVIGKRMSGVALQSIDATIKDAIVSGQERSARGIDRANFTSSVDWSQVLKGEKYVQPFGDFIVSADAVQDKVDVKIELSDGGHAYISAKNYSPKSLEKGVSNSSASLLTLIQNENKDNFINHYLNLNAVTGSGGVLDANAAEVNNLLRKILVAKLITGYNTTTGTNGSKMAEANVFVVFNSGDYTVKFYNMKDVLDGIFAKKRYESLYIPQYFYKANLRTKDYTTRISNILRQLDVRVSYTLKEEEYAKK